MQTASNTFSLRFEEGILAEVPQDDSTSHEEKMLLYRLIRELQPETVIETGTHRGLTSLYLAHALYDNEKGHLWTADPFEWGARGNFRKFPALEQHITYLQIRGSDLASHVSGIDFAFIDGFHEKREVLEEIDALFPLLRDGAVVLFHDANGSNEFCDVPGALAERNIPYELLKTENGIAQYVYHRDADTTPKGTARRAGTRRARSGRTATGT